MTDEQGADPRLPWLLSRVDKQSVRAVDELLRFITEHLAIATADAVTVRVLSEDGRSLVPVAAHHPEPTIGSAMAVIMSATQPTDSGLWAPVVAERRPRRWRMPRGYPPDEASPAQADFLREYPIRAVLGVPLLVEERLVGGVSVVRFSVDQAFTQRDEDLVVECARRIAPALDFHTALAQLGGGPQPGTG